MTRLGTDAWAYGVLTAVLIIAAVTDVRSGRIYNWTTYPAILIGLVGHGIVGGLFGESMLHGSDGTVTEPGTMGLLDSLAGLAVGFGPLLLAWLAGGVGGGDAKTMGAVGALVGWRFALTAMFYGFAVAAVMAVLVLLRRRIFRETFRRVGRFLWLLAAKARPSDPSTPESPKLPFGLALCIGALGALGCVLWLGPVDRLLWIF